VKDCWNSGRERISREDEERRKMTEVEVEVEVGESGVCDEHWDSEQVVYTKTFRFQRERERERSECTQELKFGLLGRARDI